MCPEFLLKVQFINFGLLLLQYIPPLAPPPKFLLIMQFVKVGLLYSQYTPADLPLVMVNPFTTQSGPSPLLNVTTRGLNLSPELSITATELPAPPSIIVSTTTSRLLGSLLLNVISFPLRLISSKYFPSVTMTTSPSSAKFIASCIVLKSAGPSSST